MPHLFLKILLNKNIPNKLKLTDAASIFLKKDKNVAMNYRLVSVLPAYSKIHESIMHKQMNYYISNFLWKHFCGNRKGFSTQHALILLERRKLRLDKKGFCGAILMDLS